MTLTRRMLVLGIAAGALLAQRPAAAASQPIVKVTKDPSCGCCTGWVAHLRAEGFTVHVNESARLPEVKRRLGIPAELESCHTAETSGYVLEGHVPAAAIRKLLAEKPRAKGLAVPGMPFGSPGMEVEGATAEDYDVVLFGPAMRKTFARYNGAREITN